MIQILHDAAGCGLDPYRKSCWQQLELSAPLDAAAIGGQQGATEIKPSSNPETFNILRSKLIAAGKASAGSTTDYAQRCRNIPLRPGIPEQYSAGCLQSFFSGCAKKDA
jgi:hypothetical protein